MDKEKLKSRTEAEEDTIKRKKFDEEFEDLKRQLQVLQATSDYMDSLGMSKPIAVAYAEAIADGNRELEVALLQQHIQCLKFKRLSLRTLIKAICNIITLAKARVLGWCEKYHKVQTLWMWIFYNSTYSRRGCSFNYTLFYLSEL